MLVLHETNILIDAISLFLSLLLLNRCGKVVIDPVSRKLYRTCVWSLFILICFDMLGWHLDMRVGWNTMGMVANTLQYASLMAFLFVWIAFTDYWVFRDVSALRKRIRYYAIPAVLEIVVLVVNLWTNSVFLINEDALYQRGPLYNANAVFFIVLGLSSAGLCIAGIAYGKDSMRTKECWTLLATISLPFLAGVYNAICYGMPLLAPMIAIALLVIYLYYQQQQVADMKMQLTESMCKEANNEILATQNRVSIMLSQIQPHFLYNALNTIRYLSLQDGKTAAEAIDHFAKFLRMNMDSLSCQYAIPLTQEIEHVNNYLHIEKLRFGDRLHIVMDLQCTDFDIPALTIQPIAENSIRYGINKKEDGGTLTISSYQTETHYVVKIEDDGVGFDPMEQQYDGRTHIGISNVRGRIEDMCHGTLTVDSLKGIGTSVTIQIPKNTEDAK